MTRIIVTDSSTGARADNHGTQRIPLPILAGFAAAAALGMMHGLTRWTSGFVHVPRSDLWDLDLEGGVPAWYSSLQLGVIGLLWVAFACDRMRRRERGAWVLWGPALLFLFLSFDEVAQIHEWLGRTAKLKLNSSRVSAALAHSGLWPFLCVPPFLLALWLVMRAARAYLAPRARILRTFAAGFAIFLTAAVGLELLGNLTGGEGRAYQVEVVCEEVGEMVGATLLLWATLQMLASHGVRVFETDWRHSA